MSIYFDPRIIRIFILGVASGFPWVLIGSVLTLWLQDVGVSRTSIGYAGAIFAVYSINFIWSPLLDRIDKPLFFCSGQRKSWILLTQIIMAVCCYTVGQFDALQDTQLIVLGCLLIAFTSATQDIAIDAYRIDSIGKAEKETIAYASSAAIAGWHTGFAGLGGLALILTDRYSLLWSDLYLAAIPLAGLFIVAVAFFPEPDKADRQQNYQQVQTDYLKKIISRGKLLNLTNSFLLVSPIILAIWLLSGGGGIPDRILSSSLLIPGALLAGFLLLISGLTLLNKHTLGENTVSFTGKINNTDTLLAWLASTVIEPLADFFKRNGLSLAITLLAFILLFKIGEAFLGRMSLVFYKEVGFSNEQIAMYSKFLSWGITVVFALISGWFTAKFGILRGLFIAGIAMASSNLMFSLLAMAGPVESLFALTVIVDGFTSAWSNVAFVAFLSTLCNHQYSATQYALLASLGTLGRTLFASSSGQLIDALNGDWGLFFILTALAVIPALVLLRRLSLYYRSR